MIPTATPEADDIALANAGFTRKHRYPAPLPLAPQDPNAPMLVEATLEGNIVEIELHDGRHRYTLALANAALCTVLAFVNPTMPGIATIFRPGAEGFHPFLGTARQFGVERRTA